MNKDKLNELYEKYSLQLDTDFWKNNGWKILYYCYKKWN